MKQTLAFTIFHETAPDAPYIEKLHARAFGPGRFARTASRMREKGEYDARLSFVARVETLLVGSIRQTPVKIGALSGLLLGPLTVDPTFEGKGIGKALMERSIQTARELGLKFIVLVGDAPYYARVGFKPMPMGKLKLPGPANPSRLLYLELEDGVMANLHNVTVEVG